MSNHESHKHKDAETTPAASEQSADITSQPKTNTLAVLSLITAFFMNLVGLILGIIALGQIKKTGEGGKGLAIAGIIISSIGMVIGLLFAVLFFMGLIAASTLPDDPSSESGGTSIYEEETPKNSPEVSIGEETEIGDIKLKVLSVDEPEVDEYQKPKSGNIYLSVELEITNQGYETEYISSTQGYIKDSKNQKYDYSIFALPTGTSSISGELASQDSVRGEIGFEVPEDATGLKFYFQGTDYNGAAAVVNLDR